MIRLFVFLFLAWVSFASSSFGYYYVDEVNNADTLSRGNADGFTKSSQAIWGNPASLKDIDHASVSFYSVQFMDSAVRYTNYSGGLHVPIGVIAIGYYDVRIGDIKKNSLDGNGEAVTDTLYDFSNETLKAGYQLSLNEYISLGATASLYKYNSIDFSGDGISGDLGAVIKAPFKSSAIRNAEVSVVGKNIVPNHVKFSDGTKEKIPTILSVAGQLETELDLTFYVGRKLVIDKKQLSSLGIRYRPSWIPGDALSFSAGWREYLATNKEVKRDALSLGIGLHVLKLDLSVAYQKSDYSSENFYYAINLTF